MLKTVRSIIPIPVSDGGTGASNPPAFSAYADETTQTLADTIYTKVLFQTEEFDTYFKMTKMAEARTLPSGNTQLLQNQLMNNFPLLDKRLFSA